MSYRKIKADHIFNGHQLLDINHVLITSADGRIVSIIDEKDAGDDVEFFKGIISPGFINAHCHLELSHLKNVIPQKTGLIDFVFKVVTERHFSEEEILTAIEHNDKLLLQNGIVAVGDICNNNLALTQKKQRNLHYYNFIETSGWLSSMAAIRLEKSEKLFQDFVSEGLQASVVPHAPYSVSSELWEKMTPFFQGKVISIHNQETFSENELFLHGTGDFLELYKNMGIENSSFSPTQINSLPSYFTKLKTASSVILVHNTFTSQADVDFALANKPPKQLLSFCLCPNANLFIENTLPDIEMLMKNNCEIVLGTDSLASNSSLDILAEMKTIQKFFPSIALEKMLKWATINGARALQMDHQLGSFEKEKMPGIVLIENIEDGNLTPPSSVKKIL